jgi:hypothetical protein
MTSCETHQFWAEKRGTFRQSWTQRYFSFDCNTRILSYYKTQQGPAIRSICLHGIFCIPDRAGMRSNRLDLVVSSCTNAWGWPLGVKRLLSISIGGSAFAKESFLAVTIEEGIQLMPQASHHRSNKFMRSPKTLDKVWGIQVVGMDGECLALQVRPSDLVIQLKHMIVAETGLSPNQQRLFMDKSADVGTGACGNKDGNGCVEDHVSLHASGITDGCKVYMLALADQPFTHQHLRDVVSNKRWKFDAKPAQKCTAMKVAILGG